VTAKTSLQIQEYVHQVDGWRQAGYRFVAVLGVGVDLVVHRITNRQCVRAAIDKAIASGREIVPTNNVQQANRCGLCVRRLS